VRNSIKKLQPEIVTSKSGRRYSRLPLGSLTRVEHGGYKLEGAIFATADTHDGVHAIIEQLLERVDQGLEEALSA
jgi:hypothetical protein